MRVVDPALIQALGPILMKQWAAVKTNLIPMIESRQTNCCEEFNTATCPGADAMSPGEAFAYHMRTLHLHMAQECKNREYKQNFHDRYVNLFKVPLKSSFYILSLILLLNFIKSIKQHENDLFICL